MGEQIIDTIRKIEKARTALRQAMDEERMATAPRLKDLNLIPRVYEIFKGVKGDDFNTINARKQFIFVVIYLYAPCRFFGGKMPKGLRNEISRASGVSCANTISNSCTELMVLYTAYSDFRQDVDEILNAVIEAL